MDNDFALHQLEVSLGAFVDPIPQTPLGQTSILRIQHLLEQHPDNRLRQKWSSRPRTYVLFRIVQSTQGNTELCIFIEQRLHDLLLPLPINQLPDAIKSDVELRDRFLRLQLLVLSNPVTIPARVEGASQAAHSHIDDGDSFFDTKQKLGTGGSGIVDSVVCKLTGKEYARKKIPRLSNIALSDQRTLIEFEQELAALKRLRNCSHMVQYVASYTDYKSLAFIMTPIADYDLRSFLEALGPNQDRMTDRKLLLEFFGCLATAIRTLHDCQIRHMDIKPSNILIKDQTVLVCDFGISRDWSGTSGDTTHGPIYKKTTKYCSPEVDAGEQRNKASDIFSLGVVYLEMMSVLGGFTIEAMRTFLRKNGYTTDVACRNLLGINKWIEELRKALNDEETVPLQWISRMIKEEPRLRISAEELAKIIHYPPSQPHSDRFTGPCCRPSSGSLAGSTPVGSPELVQEYHSWTSRDLSLPSPRQQAAEIVPISEPDTPLRLMISAHCDPSQTPKGEQIFGRSLYSCYKIDSQFPGELFCNPCRLEIYEAMAEKIWDCTRTIVLFGDMQGTQSKRFVSYRIPLFGLQVLEKTTNITISWKEYYRSGVDDNDTQVQNGYQTVGIVLNFKNDGDAKDFLDIVTSLPEHPLLSIPPAETQARDAVRVCVYKVYAGPKRDIVVHRILMVSRGTPSGYLNITSHIVSRDIGLTIQLHTGKVVVQLEDLRVPVFFSRDPDPPASPSHTVNVVERPIFAQSKVELTFSFRSGALDSAMGEGSAGSFLRSITGWQLLYIGSAYRLKDSVLGLRNSKNQVAVTVTLWRPISQQSGRTQVLLQAPSQSDSKKWTSGSILTSTAMPNQKDSRTTLKLSNVGRGKQIDIVHMCAGPADSLEKGGELKLRFAGSKDSESMARILARPT